MADKKLRLGLIGTGVAARELYLPAFRRLSKQLEVVACTNRTRKKAEAYARLAGIPEVLDTPAQLLELPHVEAVLISLPIDAQPALVVQALAAGKPVISEKPMAPTVAAGKKLLKAVARYEVPWLVGENFAFMPAIHRVRAWLDAGKLGDLRLVEVFQLNMMTAKNPYFHTSWRQQPKHVGGFVADAGVHLAHALTRLVGMPEVVKNLTAQFDPALRPIDTAVAVMKFPSGVLGTWTSCFSAYHQGPMLRMYGSKATVELHWSHALLRTGRGKETRFDAKVTSFEAQFSHFVDVVKKGTPVAYTPEQALCDLTLIDAIVR
jgi:predicted dehydrogenase